MKKSYEKIILAVCALAGLGLAYVGYSKSSSVDTEFDFMAKQAGKNDTAVEGAEKLTATLGTVTQPVLLEQATLGDNKRPVDNFVGVSLFAKKPAAGEKTAKPVDPVLDAPIHPPIPNIWWLENKIDPGFGDSPDRDEDKDGYSNREEFDAKTNPTDAKSFPALIQKLQFAKYESVGYFLWFSSALGPNQYQFKIVELPPAFEAAPPVEQEQFLGSSGLKYNRTADFIGSGANIFTEGYGKDRFKLKSVSEKEVTNEATKLTTKNDFAVIEDLAPNKKEEFEIPRNPKSKERPGTVRYDRTATLVLNAVGEEGKEFKVQENTTFSLPSSKGDKAYLLKKVTSAAITVEYKDAEGKIQTIEIKKN
jgi:hypothetical protein